MSKRIAYLFSLLGFLALPVKADTIVLKDATRMDVYNVEEAGKWILYTEQADADAPLQRIAADKVFAIKVGDGELKTIGAAPADNGNVKAETAQPQAEDGPTMLEVRPSADNAQRIASYNSPELKLKKPKDEKFNEKHADDFCSEFLSVWGVTSASVLADDNVAIDFEMEMPQGKKVRLLPQLKVKVTNKTDKPLYIDLANSFKFAANGTAKPFYTNSVFTEGRTGGHGASMNLGAAAGALGIGGAVGTLASGIGIGGGSSKTATVTTTEDRFLMIPPHGAVYMPPMKYASGNDLREDYETLYFRTTPLGGAMTRDGDMRRYDGNKGYVHSLEEDGLDNARYTRDEMKAPIGQTRVFGEEDTPKKLRRIIMYSTSPSFSTYTNIEFTLYMRGAFGGSLRWNVPVDYAASLFDNEYDGHLLVGAGVVKK